MAEPGAKRGTNLLEDQHVRETRLHRETRRERFSALEIADLLASDSDGPEEELFLQAASRLDLVHDPAVNLLVHARDRAERMRVHLQKVVAKLLDRFGIG